jgi:hypothetical protein
MVGPNAGKLVAIIATSSIVIGAESEQARRQFLAEKRKSA